MEINGIFGAIILVADIYAVLQIFQSNAENLHKALWIAAIILLPLLGLLIWYFFGPGGRKSA